MTIIYTVLERPEKLIKSRGLAPPAVRGRVVATVALATFRED
ncbi:MAG: hypothetical protein QNJ70_14675 [Xenococcaceae cyanobacterium MO_207.B15]|nr:hypothetical protein [Xenococcaceae cyanobacterium MO_207.B15]